VVRRVPGSPPSYPHPPRRTAVLPQPETPMPKFNSNHDLGLGWFANFGRDMNGNDTLTVRNCDTGQRIDLPHTSLETLRNICRGVHHVTPTLFPSHFPAAH
jgi:hypothetical protein